MKRLTFLWVGAIVAIIAGAAHTNIAAASGISIAPLEYKANLAKGETKKGFVDIVNPDAQTITVHLEAQAFRQINDQGGLQFYADPAIQAGVKLDLTDISLGPREGARVYFLLDASKLPSGDVFAAIFASTGNANQKVISVPSVRVGTLLLLENGTPPAHHARVDSIDADWLQIGSAVSAKMQVTNSDPSGGSALGFIPKIQIALQPYGSRTVDGPLLFAGRTRAVDYRQQGSYFGPVLVSATIDGQTQSRLVFAVTGYWQWLAPLIMVAIGAIAATILWLRRRQKQSKQLNK